ncbi:hypothetical protein GCM10009551_040360 [Nocardiopsis tropica]|uniref:DNA/RNA non-specific endonuclease n=1 Tax=Nocardiopsis tropica TaxID=109330 RepID=UPI003384E97C
MSDDLIDPDAIPVPIVNPTLLESAAGGLRTDGENIAESGQSIKSSWAGLQAVYSAPEAETLYSAVDPVATTGDSVETDFGTAATALETFAERARELRSELVQARQDARDLVAEIRSDDDWDDGGFFGGESDKVEEHNNLLNHVNSLHQQYQEAERECANAITALFGGTTFIASNADGTTQPGAGEAVYGFEEAPEDVGTPWGSPQGTDHMWYVDAIHGGGDVLMGSLEDMGGAVGIHGSEGWFTGGWSDNFTSYWGDSIAGLGAMTGFYNPQTGEMVNSPGEWWDTARGAWGDAIHGFFPWTELGERPGYVFGTVLTNIGMIAGGAALSATGIGAVVGVPMIAARVSRILGGAGTGDGPISGGIDAGGSEGSDGSSNTANNGSSPTLRPDGTHPDAPAAPDSIEPDGSGVPAGLGDMHESLSDLEAHQNQGPQADPAPVPDNSPDPTPEPSAPPAEPVTPESNPPERPESDRNGAGSQDADTPGQRADEDVRRDPTTAEVDAAFSEIARRNEDLADDMDTADGGRMAELDGEAPWTIDALENSGSTGRGDGPGGNESSRVPVTPDGMEMHADGTINNSADGDGPRLDEDSDPVTVHEDDRNSHGSSGHSGTAGSGGSGGGGPENPGAGPEPPAHGDGPRTSDSGTISLPENTGGQNPPNSAGNGTGSATSGPSDVVRQATNGPVVIDRDHPLRPLPREPLGIEFPLEPNTKYEIPDSPDRPGATYYTDDTGRIAEVHTEFGKPGRWNPDLRYPLPDVTYKIGKDLTVSTDDLGRTSRVEGSLSLSKAPRGADQTPMGHLGRDEHADFNDKAEEQLAESLSEGDIQQFEDADWDGGHLIANEFGGGAEKINMIPMLRTLNRGNGADDAWEGSWREMEKHWEKLISNDPSTSIQVSMEIVYPDDVSISNIPERIEVAYTVNGGTPIPRSFENLPLSQRSND